MQTSIEPSPRSPSRWDGFTTTVLGGLASAILASVLFASAQYMLFGYRADIHRAEASVSVTAEGVAADNRRLERLRHLYLGPIGSNMERFQREVRALDISLPNLDPVRSQQNIDWANAAIWSLAEGKGNIAGMRFADPGLTEIQRASEAECTNLIAAIEEYRELQLTWSRSDVGQRDAHLREIQSRLAASAALNRSVISGLNEARQQSALALTRVEDMNRNVDAQFDEIQQKLFLSILGIVCSIAVMSVVALYLWRRKGFKPSASLANGRTNS